MESVIIISEIFKFRSITGGISIADRHMIMSTPFQSTHFEAPEVVIAEPGSGKMYIHAFDEVPIVAPENTTSDSDCEIKDDMPHESPFEIFKCELANDESGPIGFDSLLLD